MDCCSRKTTVKRMVPLLQKCGYSAAETDNEAQQRSAKTAQVHTSSYQAGTVVSFFALSPLFTVNVSVVGGLPAICPVT